MRRGEERGQLVDGVDDHDGGVAEERHADPGGTLRGGREVERAGQAGAGVIEELERLLGEARVRDVDGERPHLEAALLRGGNPTQVGLEAERATVHLHETRAPG